MRRKTTDNRQAAICRIVFAVLALLLLCPLHAGAAVTRAKKYSLKNVTKAEQLEGEWVKEEGKVKFRLENGKYLKNRWLSRDDHIYYLNKKGVRVGGWISYRGRKYYLKKKVLLVNTFFKAGKKTYYAGPKGYILRNRWITVGESKYFVDSLGRRVKGEQYINGKWYYFKKNGKLDPKKKVIAKINPKKKMLALTFDDGPGPYTNTLLKCLKKYKARATFFMVGTNVSSYPGTVKRMVRYHCELGNHSDTHARMTSLSADGVRAEFAACAKKIRAACGHSPTVCRLPYGDGHKTGYILSAAGLPSIYWSVDTRDWANTGNPQHTVNEALSGASNGAIILMHDIHQSTVKAAQTIIPKLIKKGYQLVTVSELAKYKGRIHMSTGHTYYRF